MRQAIKSLTRTTLAVRSNPARISSWIIGGDCWAPTRSTEFGYSSRRSLTWITTFLLIRLPVSSLPACLPQSSASSFHRM